MGFPLRTILFAAAITAIALPALAQPAAAPQENVEVNAKPTEDTVVCQKSDPPLGSHIGATQVCHSVKQWRNIHENTRNFMQGMQSNGSRQAGGGS